MKFEMEIDFETAHVAEKLEALSENCRCCKNFGICDDNQLFCLDIIEAMFNEQNTFDVPNER